MDNEAPQKLEGEPRKIFDENPRITDTDKLPIKETLNALRYRTIKKNNAFGWWTAVVLLEDHGKRQVCFYRWRKRDGEWKRDRKIAFHSRPEWNAVKEGIESLLSGLDEESRESDKKPA